MAHILLWDDEPDVRQTILMMLAACGHRATDCMGRDLREIHASDPGDLMMVDMLMPAPDGIEIIMEAQRLGLTLPILAMSGGGRMSARVYLQMAIGMGAREVLAKPFTHAQLATALDTLLTPG